MAKTDGITVGAAAAAVMLADRLDDGRTGTRMFDVGTGAGEWRPVPPLNGNVFSWVGDVRPFALKRPDQLKTSGPPPLTSNKYTRDFNEVKTLGAKTGSTRTPDQEALANWIIVNPFSPVNTAFRELATSHGLSTAEQARLFAMTSLSSADAFDQLFQQQEPVPVLAAADGHPGGGHGRQSGHGCRSRLDVAVPDGRVPGQPVRLQLLRRGEHERREGVLRDRQRRVRHQECGGYAELHAVHGLRP